MYRFWAATAQALNKPDEALAAAMASTQLYDGESWGRTEQLEGDIWASLDYVDRAEHAYTVARCRSADRGLDGLRKLYRTSHGSDDGLDVHLAELLENELQNTLAPAPKFELTTIDGKTFNTDSLRGKVVVLNFWFIGCGPCRRELPELNRIAAAFASRDDIAFFPRLQGRPGRLPQGPRGPLSGRPRRIRPERALRGPRSSDQHRHRPQGPHRLASRRRRHLRPPETHDRPCSRSGWPGQRQKLE
jgi:hypothetical protein